MNYIRHVVHIFIYRLPPNHYVIKFLQVYSSDSKKDFQISGSLFVFVFGEDFFIYNCKYAEALESMYGHHNLGTVQAFPVWVNLLVDSEWSLRKLLLLFGSKYLLIPIRRWATLSLL